MKKSAIGLLAILLILTAIPVQAQGVDYLVPGGQVIGLQLDDDSVTVAAFDHTMDAGKKGGLQIGDEILSIDDTTIDCAQDVRNALLRSGGQIEMVIKRQSQTHRLTIQPRSRPRGRSWGSI